ncbi:hypothetical protein BASA81_010946 [Batrachochytrium salamandrivorans]|nr:hypothetical protein BASA81_010946 [Batrachochytrium salamandrivorans]
MFNPLLWVLPYFVTHYAGQTTQGDNDDGDGADQVSDSRDTPKKVSKPPPPARPPPPKFKTKPLQGSDTSYQNDASAPASAPADPQPQKDCKGPRWVRKIFKPCPQQKSLPGPQPSTSRDPPQSNEMLRPTYLKREDMRAYIDVFKTEPYHAFIKSEAKYFRSEYIPMGKLSQGFSGTVYIANKKSTGVNVAYKTISDTIVSKYALDPSPPHGCLPPSTLVRSKKPSGAKCTSSRPPDLMVPYEFLVNRYLSRPGYENPHVPMVLDYVMMKEKFILVMENLGGSWVDLAKYMKEKKRLDIDRIRNIGREAVKAMINLKKHGILHDNIRVSNVMYNRQTGKVKLIDFNRVSLLPGWEKGKPFPSKSSDLSSAASKAKVGDDELESIARFGHLLYNIITGTSPFIEYSDYEKMLRKALFPESDASKSKLKEKAIRLINNLVIPNPDKELPIEDILEDPFFQ